MTVYTSFIGIDIRQSNFVVSIRGHKDTQEYANDDDGIDEFLQVATNILTDSSLLVLETTGGYEMKLLSALCKKSYHAHRANTRKVKNFIRSLGNSAKTDALAC